MRKRKNLVFVYGTLRKNECNHHLLSKAKLVAEQCHTDGHLYDTGKGYPAMIEQTAGTVFGECYKVTKKQLKALNKLEGYKGKGKKNEYDRVKKTIYTDTGSLEAYVYIYPPHRVKEDIHPISSGDWKVHRDLQEGPFLYFAYGSCMDHKRLQSHGVNDMFKDILGRGIVKGYQLLYTRKEEDGFGRADIVEKNGGSVEGKLYRIPKAALKYLYHREGVASGCYRPTFLDVECNGLLIPNVLTFVVVNKEEESAPPLHYIEEIIRGGKAVCSPQYMRGIVEHVESKFGMTVRHLLD